MKQRLHKIWAFVMALVVVFSTMSFTINMHYCGDTLVETALFHKAKGCGMEMSGPVTEGCTVTKKNCCEDKQLTVEGQDELQLSVQNMSLDQHLFIASFVYTYMNLFEGLSETIIPFKDYSPPLVERDIQVLYEVYLI
ncbi:HYC_CC_PP family protein [Aestuariivivens sediminis]|uniref:HYC_CC_PP family protein n=1 Tax=Aestuariivivens sediminis TaxID=2913557 RepID=UPI001F580793|nr:hypothetical protein [Aestuariivivens sediminis]